MNAWRLSVEPGHDGSKWASSIARCLMRALWLALALLSPSVAQAQCEIDPARVKPVFSDEAREKRDAFFLEHCARLGGDLVDATDPTLEGRLQKPTRLTWTRDAAVSLQAAQRARRKRVPVVMFIVETDGSIHHVTILESSGDARLDLAAANFKRSGRYNIPAMLDGNPVRVLWYTSFRSRERAAPN